MTDAIPPLAGVIGWPVAHSRSPRLHGHWLRRYGIAGHYVPLAVRPGDLPAALAAAQQLGFRGVNVTIPHKEEALAGAAEATEAARTIGAANTLTFLEGGGYRADNTDGFGFISSLPMKVGLRARGIEPDDTRGLSVKLARRFLTRPGDFFWPPRQDSTAADEARS